MSVNRIRDGSRKGHYSGSVDFAIGIHTCDGCQIDSPEPPQSLLDELAAHKYTGTIWPFDQWTPPGWIKVGDLEACDSCARGIHEFLQRRRGRERPSGDAAIAAFAIRAAISLAREALLTSFPPPPEHYMGRPAIRNRDGGFRSFDNRGDYNAAMLRDRIREIENVLLGKDHA